MVFEEKKKVQLGKQNFIRVKIDILHTLFTYGKVKKSY